MNSSMKYDMMQKIELTNRHIGRLLAFDCGHYNKLPFQKMGSSGSGRKHTEAGDFMTFSEYFNALYPYLSCDDKRLDILDGMIGHFIYEEAQESCELLNCAIDTKRRYIKETNPNKIKPEYARYAYSHHNSDGYIEWLNDRIYQTDSYDRIENWLTDCGIESDDCCVACDILLEDILFKIAFPNASDGPEVSIPDKSSADEDDSLKLSENDKKLLKEFHIDFDSILEKCISSDQAEAWFSGRLITKINRFYHDKWKDKITGFEDIKLQSDILSTVATLQEFCKALDPDHESAPGASVRRLRIKLRDNYVKLHPDNYSGIYPYDAFIDDWNDENDY